MKLSVDWS